MTPGRTRSRCWSGKEWSKGVGGHAGVAIMHGDGPYKKGRRLTQHGRGVTAGACTAAACQHSSAHVMTLIQTSFAPQDSNTV